VLAHGCLTFVVSIELLRWGGWAGWLVGGVRGNEEEEVKGGEGGREYPSCGSQHPSAIPRP